MKLNFRMNGQGYLLADNRAAGEGKDEDDIFACSHCQALMRGRDYKHEGGWCAKCFAPLCKHCAKRAETQGCTPFRKLIDRQLEENHRRSLLGV